MASHPPLSHSLPHSPAHLSPPSIRQGAHPTKCGDTDDWGGSDDHDDDHSDDDGDDGSDDDGAADDGSDDSTDCVIDTNYDYAGYVRAA